MTSRPASLHRAAGAAIQQGKVTESATLGGQRATTRTECINPFTATSRDRAIMVNYHRDVSKGEKMHLSESERIF